MRTALATLLTLEETVAPRVPATEAGWRRLGVAAVRGGCAGLLLEALERRGWSAPEPVRRMLGEAALLTATENQRNRRQLERVAGAFAQEGVPLMVLKGAALNEWVYPRPELRPMADLDLLIRCEDAGRAEQLLVRLGFERGPGYVRADFFPRFHYEAHYELAGMAPLLVDLHVRPWRPLRYMQTVPAEALWANSREVPLEASSIRVPGNAGMLLHLAVHAACHGASRLLWLVDMQRLVRAAGADLDWQGLVESARRWKLSWPVLRGLEAAQAALGEVWPGEVMRALAAERPGWRDRLALAQAPHDAAHPVRHVLVDLLCTRGWRFRLSYLGAMLLPGREHMGQWYGRRHAGWLPVAYLLRWGRATLRPFGGP